jgi:hypothetical protein
VKNYEKTNEKKKEKKREKKRRKEEKNKRSEINKIRNGTNSEIFRFLNKK